jgi:hypothetical protein
VAFQKTAVQLNFDLEEDMSGFDVTVNYGDGSAPETLTNQNSVWGIFLSHQYQKKGTYTISTDVLVHDPANGTVRYACMNTPETIAVSVDNCVPCDGCLPSFSPSAGDKYIFTAWVKENGSGVATYEHVEIFLDFIGPGAPISNSLKPKGDIIEGWQRVEEAVMIPTGTEQIAIRIKNSSSSSVFIDDVRIHPFHANMKSFVYDPNTFRLMAELDANNYATFYEYDEEGTLIRVKRETERGVMTVQESRKNIQKKNP